MHLAPSESWKGLVMGIEMAHGLLMAERLAFAMEIEMVHGLLMAAGLAFDLEHPLVLERLWVAQGQ